MTSYNAYDESHVHIICVKLLVGSSVDIVSPNIFAMAQTLSFHQCFVFQVAVQGIYLPKEIAETGL